MKKFMLLMTTVASLGLMSSCSSDEKESGKSSEAKLISFDFQSDQIEYTQISGNKVLFTPVVEGVKELICAPLIEVSENATVSPGSGVKQDFSRSVTYTITSEDGTNTFTFTVERDPTFYDFEKWDTEIPALGAEQHKYNVTAGWTSCNPEIATIRRVSGKNIPYPINPAAGRTGKAAGIMSVDSEGNGIHFPKMTSGILYLGSFDREAATPVKRTRFGVEYNREPLRVKGFYKYQAGENYYVGTDVNASMKDAMAITAVLYEVNDLSESLTGEDLYNSKKIVARAYLSDGVTKTEFTPFDLELKYEKEYVSSKLYKFAIVFSSSRDGMKNNGAPGSTLVVDDVEIIHK